MRLRFPDYRLGIDSLILVILVDELPSGNTAFGRKIVAPFGFLFHSHTIDKPGICCS